MGNSEDRTSEQNNEHVERHVSPPVKEKKGSLPRRLSSASMKRIRHIGRSLRGMGDEFHKIRPKEARSTTV